MNFGCLRDKILSLLFLEDSKEFELTYAAIQETLKEKNLVKSQNYLQKMYKIKSKWAESYLPWKFTGGSYTTSRSESMNSLLKRYVSSKSEISELTVFLNDFERLSIYENFKVLPIIDTQYGNHPLVLELKDILFGLVFTKHLEQFGLSHDYTTKLFRSNDNIIYYHAKNIYSKFPNKYREVRLEAGKYECSCRTYCCFGFVCRHIFALANMFQDKNLSKIKIHERWQIPLEKEFQIQFKIDNYNFNVKEISETLNEKVKTIHKSKDEKKLVTFTNVKRGKGAPRKVKRAKSAIEVVSQHKSPKKSRKSNFFPYCFR